MPVARLPVLDQDEDHRMVTIPMAGQAQTPIRRRVNAGLRECRRGGERH
jgi:hypothetical protein